VPNIAEMKKIFKVTPIDQAIMLVGIHGIGKSEIVKQIFEEQGYVVITFFLGQMADAGDLIGLPDRTEAEFRYNGNVIRQKITEFCPPKWWPRDSNAKVVILMDEFNRGKPEVYQCVFDMVLNRKLNGLSLPEHTRIVSAMNPIGDEYDYDVEELDPALYDRFNVYTFLPDVDEWLDYAINTNHHKYVIGFINKNQSFLDPPQKAKDKKLGEVYPSRRSWTRVSKLLKENPDIEKEDDGNFLKTVLFGIVGIGATAKFCQYIKESAHNISGAKIVTGWDSETQFEVRQMNHQDLVHLNKEIAMYLETQEKTLFCASSRKDAETYSTNVAKYLRCVAPEIAAEFYDHLTTAHNSGKTWGDKLLEFDKNGLVDWFVSVLRGDSEHDKNVEEIINDSKPDDNFGDPDIDDIINGKI
jgi:hypothetical protein